MDGKPLQKGSIVTLTVEKIVFEGFGLAKLKIGERDLVVFLENVVPGDTVEAEITKLKKNYAEARTVKIVKLSEKRVAPRCKHFGVCGGCALQSLPYEEQLKWKESFVKDALERIGGVSDFSMEKILGCESPWFYRNKMEYTFSNGADGLSVGFHVRRRFADVFNIEECFLESEASVKIVRWVKSWAQSHNLTAYDPRQKNGLLRNLVVREGKNTGERLVNLYIAEENFALSEEFARNILREFPDEITSLFYTTVSVKKGFRTVVGEHHCAGKKWLTEKLLGLSFDIAPQAFFQPNTKQAEVLYGKIIEFAQPVKNDVVFDLFCGTGTIGMFFAQKVQRVIGVELNESAVESAKKNAEKNGLANISFLCGDMNKEMQNIPEKPAIIVVDPPRAGIAPKSLQKILDIGAPKIVYVSCNPATLARDIKILSSHYALRKAQPIDLFPQTFHIETVALLESKVL